MKLLVVGGTGTLGRQIARRALDAGHSVRCVVRAPRKAAFLQEWGCELTRGDLLEPESLAYALEDQEAVIDAATARAGDRHSAWEIDWQGKQNLFAACGQANVRRLVFLSLLNAERYPNVPLMEIKHCTEAWLQASDLEWTILRCAGFMQGLISQFAIPVLESQTVWVSGSPTPIAYMNTQDVARFESGRNASDRLAFAEIISAGAAFDAPMQDSYAAFGLDPEETTKLEDYFKEYYDTILKRLREMEADLDKDAKKKLPF
jgi:uncharacterized protein YbjT (DUF2867 family)